MNFLRSLRDLYQGLNPATLSGAIDVIVVEQPDGTLKCSPFHVRFGKMTLLRPKERRVHVTVNKVQTELRMKVGKAGECYFIQREFRGGSHVSSPTRRRTTHHDAEIAQWEWGTLPVSDKHDVEGGGRRRRTISTMSSDADVEGEDGSCTPIDSSGQTSLDVSVDGEARDGGTLVDEDSDFMAATEDEDPQLHASTITITPDWRTQADGVLHPHLNSHTRHAAAQRQHASAAGAQLEPNIALLDAPMTMFSTKGHGDHGTATPTPPSRMSDVSMSLCGPLDTTWTSEELLENFLAHQIEYLDLAAQPELLEKSDLIVRIDGRYYPWKVAAPYVMSLLAFGVPLPEDTLAKLQKQHQTQRRSSKSVGSSWFFWTRKHHTEDTDTETGGAPKVTSKHGGEASKLDCRHRSDGDLPAPAEGAPSNVPVAKPLASTPQSLDARPHSTPASTDPAHLSYTSSRPTAVRASTNSVATRAGGASDQHQSQSFPPSNSSFSPVYSSRVSTAPSSTATSRSPSPSRRPSRPPSAGSTTYEVLKKTLRPTSDQLKALNLRYGANECEFSVVSKFQGKSTIQCNIFLWKMDTKIVISDIDGTITKSDVLGHAASFVGTDWTHPGVAQLFSKIEKNGYQFLYLSSRSIGQSLKTKEYLANILQNDTHYLPDGPVLLSPASLFQSLHREVILRKPEEFKIACLQDIKSLFDYEDAEGNIINADPFVAGFGNRHTDAVAYKALGIMDSRAFIVDPSGALRAWHGTLRSSYVELSDIVDSVFVPLGDTQSHESGHVTEYTSFEYWLPNATDEKTPIEESFSLSAEEKALLGL
eukprot:m.96966 g.96966  ORF g.96966 m.96966 type:complete len:817 (+) comp13089_c0_seq1:254-2704(+)